MVICEFIDVKLKLELLEFPGNNAVNKLAEAL